MTLIKNKGHTYEYNKNKKGKWEKTYKYAVSRDDILAAEYVTEKVFKDYVKLQEMNDATREQKIIIEKHILKKV